MCTIVTSFSIDRHLNKHFHSSIHCIQSDWCFDNPTIYIYAKNSMKTLCHHVYHFFCDKEPIWNQMKTSKKWSEQKGGGIKIGFVSVYTCYSCFLSNTKRWITLSSCSNFKFMQVHRNARMQFEKKIRMHWIYRWMGNLSKANNKNKSCWDL